MVHMIRQRSGESWKPLTFAGWKELRNRYAVSSHGRIASYKKNLATDGKLLRGSITTGYRTLNLHRPGNKGTLYIHREIAKHFLPKPSPLHRFVIHRNHLKLDNRIKNLSWVTQEQMIAHQQKSPARKAYKAAQLQQTRGLKLTLGQVKKIKSLLADKNRSLTIRQMARQYGVSEMTLYRIRSGENWGRV